MLEKYKILSSQVALQDTASLTHSVQMISGVCAHQKLRCLHVDHMADTHEIHYPIFVRTQLLTVRCILIDHIINVIFLPLFFPVFHAVFEEIVAVVLGHHAEFLIYQLNLLAVPVRL